MIRYVLCRYALAQPGEIEISEAEYLSLAKNIKALVELSDLEEKYNAFIDNYFELERGLLEEALSRRIINLLTSIKLYLDSYPQHAARLVTGEELRESDSSAVASVRPIAILPNYGGLTKLCTTRSIPSAWMDCEAVLGHFY
jgi:hypothetical protein